MTNLILKVLCGSRTYNLHRPDSDYNYHGVFVTSTRELLSLGPKPKDTHWIEGDEDHTSWEIGHFLKLATMCNPTILETFVAPAVELTVDGEELRMLFPYVLSKYRIYDAFRGYASNQQKKMLDPKIPEWRRRKFAVAYMRVFYHGIDLMTNGTYTPWFFKSGNPWSELTKILVGISTMGYVIDRTEILKEDFKQAVLNSSLPEEPNIGKVNEFLLSIRKRNF